MKEKAKTASVLMLVLILTLFFVFLPFLINGKYLAWIGILKEKDGITQHATFLQYLVKTNWNFINHFDFNIGLGADYFTTFIYYMIADPFNLLLILFPFSNFLITYSLLIIFKFLACGIFMYVYLRHKKITPRIAIPISALYMIGGFLLFTFPRHPDLSNGAIYLPLIILGVELIFDNKKPYLLLFSTFFCFISNFYIFYMVSVFVVLYTILYYFEIRKERSFKDFIFSVGKVAFWYLIGILLASLLTFPLLSAFIHSARSESKGLKGYSIIYYLSLIGKLFVPSTISISYYTPLSFHFIMLLCLIPLFFFQSNKTYKICILVLFIGLFVPLFGWLMNGFNYVNNRWLFLFDFVVCVCLALSFKQLKENTSSNPNHSSFKEKVIHLGRQSFVMPLLFVVTLLFNQVTMWNYQKEFDDGTVWAQQETIEEQYIANLQENSTTFFRTDKGHEAIFTDNYSNTPIKNQYQGTYMYNTITNQEIYDFLKSLGMYNATHTLGMSGLNQRKAIQSLLSVLYYIPKKESVHLYGYHQTSCENVYQNEHYLPLGFLYLQKMSAKEYYELPIVERQAALMRYLIDFSYEERISYQTQTEPVSFTTLIDKGIEYNQDQSLIIVNEKNAQMHFNLSSLTNQELYMNFEFVTNKEKKQEIIIESDTMQYHQKVFKKGEQMYFDQKEFSYCLGYYDTTKPIQVTVTFLNPGTYSLKNLSFYTYSMEDFIADYQQLKENSMEITKQSKNTIKGKIKVLQDQASLFFSIPYNKGWKIKVDGKEKPLYQAQIGFMAVDLDAGEHEIELFYQTPYLKQGAIVSGCVAFFICGYVLYDQVFKKVAKNRKNKYNKINQ